MMLPNSGTCRPPTPARTAIIWARPIWHISKLYG